MPNFSSSNSRGTSARKRTGVGSIRRSQLITTFGPGAIVELPEYAVVLNSAESWFRFKDHEPFVLHDPNLEHILGVEEFREPPTQERHGFAPPLDISATRFPYYHFCPRCGDLKRYWDFPGDGRTCRNGHTRTRLIPSRFVVICERGHMEDFPYRWWVHEGHPETCTGDGNNLRLETSDAAEGLSGIRVTCRDCGASRTMAGALGSHGLKGYHCRGHRPWVYGAGEQDCKSDAHGALRTAANVYFPVTESALTIPPWSTNLQQYLAASWSTVDSMRKHLPEDKIADILLSECQKHFQPGENFTKADVLEAMRVRLNGPGEDYDVGSLRQDEYKVLSAGSYQSEDDLHFRTEHAAVPPEFSGVIDQLVLVKRLREVLALKGFTRVHDGGTPWNLQPPGVPHSEWLPAVEMIGEGIFVRLREEAVQDWTARVAGRYGPMEERLYASELGIPAAEFSPRFVLLHTLAHLLIRQLAFESGYNAASIKERLYSSDDPDQPMAGILLYTASSDADGSLGGLVRRGQQNLFAQTLQSALDEAIWCSADPVCMESQAQGFDDLNYAACYSCTLLPETSCEVSNCCLDRTAVIGTAEDRSTGYLGSFVPDGA